MNLWLGYFYHQASESLNHTLLVEREEYDLLNAAIDIESRIVEGEQPDRGLWDRRLNRLYNLLEDNPKQRQQLDHIKYIYNQWQNELSQQEVAHVRSQYSHTSRDLVDSLRTQINTLIPQQQKLLSDRAKLVNDLYHLNIFLNILIAVMMLLVVGFHLQLLYRRVQVPLHKLTAVSKLWRKGNMEVKIGYSVADKIGYLAEILDGMVSDIHRRQTSIKARNHNLEELICALSHDIRTPLLATRNTLESMLKGAFGSVSDTWREVLAEYYQANEELLELVEVLLDISRYEAGNRVSLNYQPLNWEQLFVKVIAQVQAISESKCCLDYKIGRSLPTIYGDELEMRRVLQNLLDNAVRVSEPNKQILIEVASFKDNQVKVSVCDQGIGIAPQEKEQLFQRFIQGRGRRGKSGLGLYLCRQIIEAHGGTIGVDSSQGLGSTFWFTLPVNTDKARFHYLQDWECRTRNYA
ncbi:sensor histidine kinase [Calothrix sp. NIES-2100]|uniref:sensor histidine kinase n=1 Tax=Calothrix sp. NIES-2100 TaxID=1954172 RepID=UPI0030D6D56A